MTKILNCARKISQQVISSWEISTLLKGKMTGLLIGELRGCNNKKFSFFVAKSS
jgi:hypothetical protein